ncbi:MAG: acyl--CoA ligase [Lachnospiraceae bacterium]|nr:acyl--CoA ligase [Lachnospiraceae bacterium]
MITEEKVWLKYYSEEAKNAEVPRCKAYDYVIEQNKDRLDKPALHYYGRDISFRELMRQVDACADSFAALGVKEGDIVSFLSVAVPETIVAVYALNKIGAAANTVDPRMDVGSIKRMMQGAGSKVLLVLDVAFSKLLPSLEELNPEIVIVQSAAGALPVLKRLVKASSVKTKVPYGDKIIRWSDFLKKGKSFTAKEAPYVGDALVAITYTGGTTGRPKGVMMTNDSMNAVSMNFIYSSLFREDGDRFLGIIPIFSAYGMVCGMHMPLCMRITLVPIPRFVPGEIGKLVRMFRPQHMISTPVFIELLIGSREVQKLDMSFLYTLASGGDSMNEGLERKLNRFRKKHNMKYPLAQGYGMSELSAAATFCSNHIYKQGSVGIPSLNVTVGIFDPETGEELGYRESGEVCVTGPSMMKGYFNNPEETAYVMRTHGDGKLWIHSGDLGYMDEDGFLYIKGRMKRMITRFDGHKVFPINLESLIVDRANIRNCAVIGVKDREHSQGHYPLALVELLPGTDAEKECAEIREFCEQNVEERGKPVAVVPVEKIPLTGMGKIDYRALEKQYDSYNY